MKSVSYSIIYNSLILLGFLIFPFSVIFSQEQVIINFQSNSIDFPALNERSVQFSNQFIIQLHAQNPNPNMNYRLGMKIRGANIEMTSIPHNYYQDITFSSGPTLNLFSKDVAAYFDIENLNLKGISKEQYLDGGLPEGAYNVCVEVYNISSDNNTKISNTSCINLIIRKNLPPQFTLPSDNDVLSLEENILFSWFPRHISISPTKYNLLIYEYDNQLSQVEYIATQRPIIDEEIFSPQYLYNSQFDLLKRKKRYVAFVQAEGMYGNLYFENGGYSDPIEFEMENRIVPQTTDVSRSLVQMNCLYPDGTAFFNEISNGQLGSYQEFIEIVVAGTGSNESTVNLEEWIIDDNNYAQIGVGNESGHIRLGSCLNAVPRGSIILIYKDDVDIPGIDPANDGTPNSQGVYQIPFSHGCILKYTTCPNVWANDVGYGCTKDNDPVDALWNNIIPMRNDGDVIQLRNPDQGLEHAIVWLTDKYDDYNNINTIKIPDSDIIDAGGYVSGNNFIMNGGDWFSQSNYSIVPFESESSPGVPNNSENEILVTALKELADNDEGIPFEITCEQVVFYNGVGAEIEVIGALPSSSFKVTLNGSEESYTTTNPIIFPELNEGDYFVEVYDYLTGCEASCNFTIKYECTAGEPCNDFNECTHSDQLDEDCNCIGIPISDVIFEIEPVYKEICTNSAEMKPKKIDHAYSYYDINSIVFELVDGTELILDETKNNQDQHSFNFPYRNGGGELNNDLTSLKNHLNDWINVNPNIVGSFKVINVGNGPNSSQIFRLIQSNIRLKSIRAKSNIDDNFNIVFDKTNCIQTNKIEGYTLSASVDCDEVLSYEWGNGETTESIFLLNESSCIMVSIECTSGCTFTELYQGSNPCDCIIGTPCNVDDECILPGTYGLNCECEGSLILPDDDDDGNCNEIDLCHGFNDNDDSDMDGVPDGCDICHGQDDALVYDALNDNDPFNDPICEDYPCNDVVSISDELVGGEVCDYCALVSSPPIDYNILTLIRDFTVSKNGISQTVSLLTDWEDKIFDSFDNVSEEAEEDWGVWSASNNNAYHYEDIAELNSDYIKKPNSGKYCLALSDGSSIKTNVLDFNRACLVKMEFSFITEEFEDGYGFYLELDRGTGFEFVQEWNHGDDFLDRQRQNITTHIAGPFDESSRFRLVSTSDDGGMILYIDDISFSMTLPTGDEGCINTDKGLEPFVLMLGEWLDKKSYGGKVSLAEGGYPDCTDDENDDNTWIHITETSIKFENFTIWNGENLIEIPFSSQTCGDLNPGEYNIQLTAEIDCSSPSYSWSTGESTSTIIVPNNGGGYVVTVTCGDGCEYTALFGDENCIVGTSCLLIGDPCYPEDAGIIDENCDCIGDPSFALSDIDFDGIPDCIDKCPYGPNVDLDGNGTLDCLDEENCDCDIDPFIIYTEVIAEVCDECYDLSTAAQKELLDVKVELSPGNLILLSDQVKSNGAPYFTFPYCYNTTESNVCFGTPSMTNFVSHLNHFMLQYANQGSHIGDIQINLLEGEEIGVETCNESEYVIRINNSPFDGMLKLMFASNISVSGVQNNCQEQSIGFRVGLNESNCRVCEESESENKTYLWSNGSTISTPFSINDPVQLVASPQIGFSVTITCGVNECEYIIGSEGPIDCIVGASCEDDGDPCTDNTLAYYDENCNCAGTTTSPDEDADGVPDLCDACPGYDDTIDSDYDGVPNGCDQCLGFNDDYAEYVNNDDNPNNDVDCMECDPSQIPMTVYNSNLLWANLVNCVPGQNILINNLTGTINGTPFNLSDFDQQFSFPYCRYNGSDCDPLYSSFSDFIEDLQEWLINGSYLGIVSSDGIAFRITDSEVRFGKMEYLCSGANERYKVNFETTSHEIYSGIPCDDGDPCTVNDTWNQDCECIGTYLDDDNDSVCNALDQCPGYPDYLGCNTSMDCNFTNDPHVEDIPLCDYIIQVLECAAEPMTDVNTPFTAKAVEHNLMEIASSLREMIQQNEQETGVAELINFDIPQLLYDLQNSTGSGVSTGDTDGDGIINYLDPMPENATNSTVKKGYFDEDHVNAICSMSPENLNVLRYFAFSVVDYMNDPAKENECNNPDLPIITPGCASDANLKLITGDQAGEIEIYEDRNCVLRDKLNDDKTVHFKINCECDCVIEYGDSPDEVNLTTCDIPCDGNPWEPCWVYALVPNPDYNPDDPDSQSCICQVISTNDEDGDTVCDIEDVCPGLDDLADADGDTLPDCLDECPNTPGAIGDPCDDGNPCTFADAVDENCNCVGKPVDVDEDGVPDCQPCDCAKDYDADGYVDEIVPMNYDEDDPTATIICDVCPDMDDTIDEDNNDIPDCLENPFIEIGCPVTFEIIPSEGIVLFFDSQEITLDQLPEPINVTMVRENSQNDYIKKYDHLTISNIRETPDSYEVFFSIPDIESASDYSFIGLLYSEHQECILSESATTIVDINCPSEIIYTPANDPISDKIELIFTIPPGFTYDYLGVNGSITFDLLHLSLPTNPINGTYDIIIENTVPNDDHLSISFYSSDFAGTQNINEYNGTITLPSGVVCNYLGGGLIENCTVDGQQVSAGDPCDDGDECTHHDKIVQDNGTCHCEGEPNPDSDGINGGPGDGFCDAIDPCPNEYNEDIDGDGIPDLNGCPCPDIIILGSELVNGSDFEIELDMTESEQFEDMTVEITGGPEDITLNGMSFSSPFVVPNLTPGYELTITLIGQCKTGGVSSNSLQAIVPFESNPAFCGLNLDPVDLTSFTLLPYLNKDDKFTASDFEITVSSATGSFGEFSGTGYIQVPYLNFARINISFNDITLSSHQQMINGVIDVNGYGLAILGDDISNAINDHVNTILGGLEDLEEILAELIPLLEQIEDLVETTGDLVEPEQLECIELAKNNLEALMAQTDPVATEAQIQIATAELAECHEKYKEDLEAVLNRLIELMNKSIVEIPLKCATGDMNDDGVLDTDIGEVASNFDVTFTDVYNNIFTSSLDGSGIPLDVTVEIHVKEETPLVEDYSDFIPSDHLLGVEISEYLVVEKNYALCHVFELFDPSGLPNSTNVSDVTAILKSVLLAGTDVVTELKDDLKSDKPIETIYLENEQFLIEAFGSACALIYYK